MEDPEDESVTDNPRNSWDFDYIQKKAVDSLTASHLKSYRSARKKPRTSDRSRDSVTELVPEEELQHFLVTQSVVKNSGLARIVDKRDLVAAILSTVLLFSSIIIFACIQVIQPVGYNSKVPDRFYTEEFRWHNEMQNKLFYVYIGCMTFYIISFGLSARWKLEMDAEIKLKKLRQRELIHFVK